VETAVRLAESKSTPYGPAVIWLPATSVIRNRIWLVAPAPVSVLVDWTSLTLWSWKLCEACEPVAPVSDTHGADGETGYVEPATCHVKPASLEYMASGDDAPAASAATCAALRT